MKINNLHSLEVYNDIYSYMFFAHLCAEFAQDWAKLGGQEIEPKIVSALTK